MTATTPIQITGIVLLVLGILFIVAGLVRFGADMYLQLHPPVEKHGAASDLDGAANLLDKLSKLPPWAMSAVIGVGLILVGGYMSQGHTLVP